MNRQRTKSAVPAVAFALMPSRDNPECFVIMPISTPRALVHDYNNDSDHFGHVLAHLFAPAVDQAGFELLSPVARGSDLIHAEIVRQLETADLVLCDMSTLNANVFFELGIRTAVDKPVCLVKDLVTPKIPFDTAVLNAHTYDHSLAPWLIEAQIASLADHLQTSAERSNGRNTMWQHFGLTTRASFESSDRATSGDKLDFLISEVANISRSLDRQFPISLSAHQQLAMAAAFDSSLSQRDAELLLTYILQELEPAERRLITLRFGLDGAGPRTLGDVAQILGMSPEHVRHDEARVIARIRNKKVQTVPKNIDVPPFDGADDSSLD